LNRFGGCKASKIEANNNPEKSLLHKDLFGGNQEETGSQRYFLPMVNKNFQINFDTSLSQKYRHAEISKRYASLVFTKHKSISDTEIINKQR